MVPFCASSMNSGTWETPWIGESALSLDMLDSRRQRRRRVAMDGVVEGPPEEGHLTAVVCSIRYADNAQLQPSLLHLVQGHVVCRMHPFVARTRSPAARPGTSGCTATLHMLYTHVYTHEDCVYTL